ncbi:MAG TPA: DMT family transporter [Hyphomicrobiaceae bacterium]|nr:DMT family transporter [Hyphomicrobiaceae bacterium]
MNDNARGIFSVLIASTAFVINDVMVKLTSAELPSGEIIFVRGALATVMLTIAVLLVGAGRPLSLLIAPMMLVRLSSAAAATVFIVLCLRHLPLATVNTALQVTPLAVTAGAALIFRERVPLKRWAAALAGFVGVALIVRPDTGSFGIGAPFVLLTLVSTTIRDLTTRGLAQDIPSIFVAAGSAAVISLAGFAVAPFEELWHWPSTRAWLWLTSAAASMFIATTFMIIALRIGEVSVVAPFRYVPVPLSIVLGWWLWSDVPDAMAWLGIALILAAGLYVLHQERPGRTRGATASMHGSPAE